MNRYRAAIKDGKLLLSDRPAFDAALKRLADGDYSLTLDVWLPRHSDAQRGYWFAVIVPHAVEGLKERGIQNPNGTPLSKEGAHEILMWILAPEWRSTVIIGKEPVQLRARMSKMDKGQVSQVIERGLMWLMQEFGIYCPSPDEYYAALP